jgi:cytochrome c-type biogenesis protein
MELDFSSVSNFSLWAYLVVFVGGIVTSIGPCNIAMIPLVIAFVGGQKDIGRGRSLALSSAFALGLAVTLMILGVVASIVGGMIGGNTRVWYYIVAAVCIVMGLQWVGVFSLPLPDLAGRSREKIQHRGVLGALLLGLASGLVASGCATPALAAILTLVMSEGAIAYGASLLLVYGLGRGVPIVLFGTFAGLIRLIPQMMRWTARLEQVSGVLMIGIGLYFLWAA